MPSPHIVKYYEKGGFYHIYNRGVNKRPIFCDNNDKRYFLHLIARYLAPSISLVRSDGAPYDKYHDYLSILSFCLMGNHLHLLIYVHGDEERIPTFFQSLFTAYTMYFNKRHKRLGGLFQSNYKASHIGNEAYLLHISRYIHMNPRTYKTYRFSSLRFYLDQPAPEWLNTSIVKELFEGYDYLTFHEEYKGKKRELELIGKYLAHD